MVDTRMDGLPMDRVIPSTATERPMHDKAVDDGPTTENGLLSRAQATLDDRLIAAQFATEAEAAVAQRALLQAGFDAAAVRIAPHAASDSQIAAHTAPADDTLLGRIREAVLPNEPSAASRAAIAGHHALLEVRPQADQVEMAVRIIEQHHPVRFDADLERWRNKG